jgi:hypothetical protein
LKSERSGVVGRILADRPITTALAAAVGLVSLAYLGVEGAAPGAVPAGELAKLLLAFLALPVAPLALAAFAPKGRRGAVVSFVVAAAATAGLWFALPLIAPALPNTDSRFFAVGLALFAIFLLLRPALGAALRFCFIGAGAAVLGVAGAAGAMANSGAPVGDIAALAALGLGLAATVSVGVIADFSAFFARGVEARRAAIAASEQAIAPVALATALAFVSVTLHSLLGGAETKGLGLAWIAALAAGLAAGGGAAFSTGALSLSQADEMLAVDDNLRRQRLRRFWRPLRQALTASVSYAVVAILFIVALAAAFDLKAPPKPALLLLAPAAGVVAGFCYMSLRGGLIVAVLMTTAAIASSWLADRGVLAELSDMGSAVAYGALATGFALLALSWRDARSPRLNARETMEAALTDGVGRFAVSMATAAGALYAAGFSGAWPEGVEAAGRVLLGALIGAVFAPALMTALAALGGRERY